MNSCEECTVCCDGSLIGEAYGHQFGNGVSCKYLDGKCSIYHSRPTVCKNYFCAYAQNIIPSLQRPDRSGILVSVKDGTDGKQFLEFIVTNQNYNPEQINLIHEWASQNKTYVMEAKSQRSSSQEPQDILEIFCNLIQTNNPLVKQVIDEFAKKVSTFEEYDSVAKNYFKNKFYEDSLHFCRASLNLAPNQEQYYITKYNLCNILNHANYPEEALFHIKELKLKDSKNIQYYLEEAYAYFLKNEKDKAEKTLRYVYENFNLTYEQATKIRFNLGTYHLYRDEFHTGLKLFLEEGAKLKYWNVENIFNRKELDQKYNINMQEWNGDTIPGATILCYAEAGIGDEIINVRFMREIQKRGMRAIWFNDLTTRNDLVQIFNQNGYETYTSLDQLESLENTYYVHGMTLPYKLKLEYPDLWHGPYLKGSEVFKEKWKEKTKTNKKLKVGIRWKGMPDYDQDLHRSVPLKQIYDKVKHLDADFYSLQIDNYEEEIHDFPELIDLHDQLESWHDTFGLIDNLDFVITSCTSVAHAVASTGARVFVFVPISAYYTWSHSMKQSPWYGDNVTILRQERPRVWDEPCDELQLGMKNYES